LVGVLLRKNKARVIATARNKTDPIIAPAMLAAEMTGGELVELGEEGSAELVCVGLGGLVVVEGELLSIQLLSSEAPTDLISELPPWRPWESVMKKIIEVPRAALTVHV
jgi:hypothetical protein